MSEGAAEIGAIKRGGLAQRRKAVGLTQEQLAEQLGVEHTTVVRWETRRNTATAVAAAQASSGVRGFG